LGAPLDGWMLDRWCEGDRAKANVWHLLEAVASVLRLWFRFGKSSGALGWVLCFRISMPVLGYLLSGM
jgi:hypothetical protein